MTEAIGYQLKTLLSSTIPFYLSEAEADDYPYAVYQQTVTPAYTKDGVYKFVADTHIKVYDKNFDNAQTKVDAIKSAIGTGMTGTSGYFASFIAENKDCVEGVWVIDLQYKIIQIQ